MRNGKFARGLFFIGGIAGICVIALHAGGKSHEIFEEIAPMQPPAVEKRDKAALSGYDMPQAMPSGFVSLPVSEIADTRYLELVNHEHPIHIEPERIVSAWPTVPVSTKEVTIHETALQAVGELIGAARETYDGTFYIASGYRNREEQMQAYNNAPDKSYVQPSGHSEHHTGLAADIFIMGIGQHDMTGRDEVRWLAENAWRYGLILRYGGDKRNITGIADEPWHFRYVGQIHAWYCHQNNLCLEEYIQYLKDGGGYSADLDGLSYSVSYQTPDDGAIYVPGSGNYNVSHDNAGGYIVTAWEK